LTFIYLSLNQLTPPSCRSHSTNRPPSINSASLASPNVSEKIPLKS